MTSHDSELLKAYAADGSEPAFNELVRRHLGLVHSAALRLLDGNAAEAEDVAQTVFTDLARKARELANHGSLAGWLHTSTRFAAGKLRRTEQRRRQREHATMHAPMPDDSGTLWEEIRPCLDDALHELPETDREAVLLRFFEKLSLTEVGSRLGVGEDAARKRVDRALDKLRGLLAARGVTSATTAGLMAAFTAHLTAEASVALQQQIARTALQQATAGTVVGTAAVGGWLAWFLGWPAKAVLVAGIAAIVATVLWPKGSGENQHARSAAGEPTTNVAPVAGAEAASAAGVSATASATSDEPAGSLALHLYLVEAATLRPVPGGEIEFRGWKGEEFIGRTFRSDSNGYSRVHYPSGITDLEVTTRIDGLADTRLKWTPKNGEIIPPDYTLKLVKGTAIGGVVVDEDGRPVAGAKVGFNHNDDPQNYKGPESHEFSWIEMATDTEGRWKIDRFAPNVLRRIRGSARHPDFGPSQYIDGESTVAQLPSLTAKTHRFVLTAGFVVQGTVVDPDGQPVEGADILVGLTGFTDSRKAKSGADGVFLVRGCQAGESPISASAKGFAVTSIPIKVGPMTEPVNLVLRPGRVVRLKVVDEAGRPIHRAWTVYVGRSSGGPFGRESDGPQVEFQSHSDRDGLIVWSNAPTTDLNFSFAAAGKMRRDGIRVAADKDEHEVVLSPALRLRGEVRDAVTGQLIPQFRLSLGWPQMRALGVTNAQFSGIDRFYSDHVGGRFDKFVEETTIGGENPPPCMFKVEADGYAPFVSRQIGWDEGEVIVPVALQPVKEAWITLLRPDGTPAAETEVAAVRPESRFVLQPGGFDALNSSEAPRRTDAQGRIKLALDETILLVVAAGAEGYGEFLPRDIRPEEPLHLQSWSRIEGQLKGSALAKSWDTTPGSPPVENHVTLQRAGVRPQAQVPFQASYWRFQVKAENDGRFTLPMVPAGEWSVVPVRQRQTAEGYSSYSSGNAQRVMIPPGEMVEVVLGGSGSRIVAKVGAMPTGVGQNVTTVGSIVTAGYFPPKELWKSGMEQVRVWFRRSEVRTMDVKQFQCVFENGEFVAEEIPPGSYTFHLLVRPAAQDEAGRGINTSANGPVAIGQQDFTVPDPAPPEGIDLGEIRLEPVGK